MNLAESFKKKLKRIDNLPTLPTVLQKIIEMTSGDEASAQDVIDEMSADQSLTANLLKVANSPMYGVSKRIESIRQAVVLLGFQEVRNIALSASVFSTLAVDGQQGTFDRQQFWAHSYLVGYLTRDLYKLFPDPRNKASYFTCGLLHDIGKVALDQYFMREFFMIVSSIRDRKISACEAEKSLLMMTHADIGALLLGRWRLPAEQVTAVGEHHTPWNTDSKPAIALYYANLLAIMLGYSSLKEEPTVTLDSFYASDDVPLLEEKGLLLPRETLAAKLDELRADEERLAEAMHQSVGS